jgi:hypothetical protein
MKVRLESPTPPRVRCSFCHGDGDGRLHACEGCGGWTHAECLRTHGGCPTLGCEHGRAGPRKPPDVARPGRERRLALQREREEATRRASLERQHAQESAMRRDLAETIFAHATPPLPSRARRALLFARLALSMLFHAAGLFVALGAVPWFLGQPDTAALAGLLFVLMCGGTAVYSAAWLWKACRLFGEVNELLRATAPVPMRLHRSSGGEDESDVANLTPIGHGGASESHPIGLLLTSLWLHLLSGDEVVQVYGSRPEGPRVLQRRSGALALLHR